MFHDINIKSTSLSLTGLSPRHQIVLRWTRDELVKKLESEPVLTGLLAKLKISQEEYNKINTEKTREEQVKSLLDLLPRKDQTTFDEFSQVLNDNQGWLHEKLSNTLEKVTEGVFDFRDIITRI